MDYRAISKMLGTLLLGTAVFILISGAISLIYKEYSSMTALLVSTVITAGLGGYLYYLGKDATQKFFAREAVAMVTLGWFGISLLGALPYLFSGTITSISGAIFESASGFTTTGSTVITDIEACSKGILFWRSITQWLGGMGIIVLFIAIMPNIGSGARHMFKSEVPGPKSEGLRPKLRETSMMLWKIYLGITVIEFIALYLCGMNVYDAACHSLACMATGGFSTKNDSIAHWDSATIDLVITFFMFLAGINFALYYALLRGKTMQFWKNYEFRTYVILIVVCTIIVTIWIIPMKETVFDAFRYAVFQTVGLLTTTGFGTDDFNIYPPLARILLVILMFIGGSAGSTAGGMKVIRIITLFKASYREIYKAFHPHAVISIKIGKSSLDEGQVRTTLVFFALFIISFTIGTLFMSALGLDLETAFSSVVATLANIGPGLDKVGAMENYAHIPAAGKFFLSFCMILGRLELFSVLVLFVPAFWKR